MARPVAVDLFSGAGGLSLGLEQAGFEVAVAIEIDPIHAAAHKFNFPKTAVLPRSVVGLSVEDIRNAAEVGGGHIDLVAGGPPCQGFSMIGHRALDDPRNALVGQFVRIVKELDAPYFLFENVKGLTIGAHRRFLDEVVAEFRANGYEVRPPTVLNAAHFGVPQERERLFLIGAQRGLPLPEYPAQLTYPAGSKLNALGIPEGPSCRDALDDVPNADEFAELVQSESVITENWPARLSEYAALMHCDLPGSWHRGKRREWNPSLLTNSGRTGHTEISKRRFAETPPGTVEPVSRFYRLPPNGVSHTLRAGTDSARGAFTSPRPIHYKWARCVTVREMARLHGFPDWFRFHETKWHGARQIGNAVAPPIARCLGVQYANAMRARIPTSTSAVPLGDAILLRMDMSEASAYWNVPVPIGRRDRKSGARKRKQSEIETARLASLEP